MNRLNIFPLRARETCIVYTATQTWLSFEMRDTGEHISQKPHYAQRNGSENLGSEEAGQVQVLHAWKECGVGHSRRF